MRFRGSHILFHGLLTLASVTGCRNPDAEGMGPGTDVRKEPPGTYENAYSKNVSFRQDTALLEGRPFSGFLLQTLPNGDTAACTGYLNGLQEGTSRIWHPNGSLSEERTFHRGRKVGTHRGWWPNGKRRFEYTFRDGEHHGAMLEWYEDGRPYREFHHREGYEEGSQRMWWEDGGIRANYVVRNGRRYGLIGVKNCVNPKDSLDR